MSDQSLLKRWKRSWDLADQALSKEKKVVLANPNYYQSQLDFLNSILKYTVKHAVPRFDRGLIEQQKLFAKLRN